MSLLYVATAPANPTTTSMDETTVPLIISLVAAAAIGAREVGPFWNQSTRTPQQKKSLAVATAIVVGNASAAGLNAAWSVNPILLWCLSGASALRAASTHQNPKVLAILAGLATVAQWGAFGYGTAQIVIEAEKLTFILDAPYAGASVGFAFLVAVLLSWETLKRTKPPQNSELAPLLAATQPQPPPPPINTE